MTHLSPEQLIDLVEDAADPGAAAHARTCDHCRAEIEALRATIVSTAADPGYEPPSMFWDHFSSRVGAAVRDEAGTRARRTAWIWRWGSLSALGATVLVAALVVMPRDPAAEPAAPTAAPAVADELAADADASWLFVRDLSLEFTVEAAGVAMPAGPGAADRALADLTAQERAALVDLVRAEMARASERNPEPSDQ